MGGYVFGLLGRAPEQGDEIEDGRPPPQGRRPRGHADRAARGRVPAACLRARSRPSNAPRRPDQPPRAMSRRHRLGPREGGRDRAPARGRLWGSGDPDLRAGRRAGAQPARRALPHRRRGARGRARPALGALPVHPGTRVERRGRGGRRGRDRARARRPRRLRGVLLLRRLPPLPGGRHPSLRDATTSSASPAAAATASSWSRRGASSTGCRTNVPLDAAVLVEPASVVLPGALRAPSRGRERRSA